jgi:hypothetical protein
MDGTGKRKLTPMPPSTGLSSIQDLTLTGKIWNFETSEEFYSYGGHHVTFNVAL